MFCHFLLHSFHHSPQILFSKHVPDLQAPINSPSVYFIFVLWANIIWKCHWAMLYWAGPFTNSVVIGCILRSTISKVLCSSGSFNFTTRLVQKRHAGKIKPFLYHLPSSPLWELKLKKPCKLQVQLFHPLPTAELLTHNIVILAKWTLLLSIGSMPMFDYSALQD